MGSHVYFLWDFLLHDHGYLHFVLFLGDAIDSIPKILLPPEEIPPFHINTIPHGIILILTSLQTTHNPKKYSILFFRFSLATCINERQYWSSQALSLQMSYETVSWVMLGLLRTCRMYGLSDRHIEYSSRWCFGCRRRSNSCFIPCQNLSFRFRGYREIKSR